MKKIIAILLVFCVVGLPAFAFSEEAKCPKGLKAEEVQVGEQKVTTCCPGRETYAEKYPMGKGGGRSDIPNAAAQMAAKNQQAQAAVNAAAKSYQNNTQKETNELMDSLLNCITGLNKSLFKLPDFSQLFEQIMKALLKKACDFAKQKSAEYIAKALEMFSYDLPMGLGHIGATTTILGYTPFSITVGGTAKDMLNQYQQTGSVIGSPQAPSISGIELFRNAGGVFMNKK